ncbi:MAG: flagellar biosynthesis protein FlhB [Alphaproteobacteria bacterium]|nr:flagellar biosynthesis protein FlhB [Alphaproteobacteria bacterium]
MAEGEEQDETSKTEEPTPKKIEEARKKGQVALSREVNNWVMLLAGTIVIGALANSVFRDLTVFMRAFIEVPHEMPPGAAGVKLALGESFKQVLKILALPLIILMLAAFAGPFAQVGPLFAPDIVKPDFSKVSPMKGFFRLFSRRSLMEFVKGLLKIGLVGLVGTIILRPYFGQLDHLIGLPMALLLSEMRVLVVRLMIGILVVLLVVAILDLVYQRLEHHKKMRMSKQEIKDEYKQSEGDPHVKARLRQLRSERARKRMIQSVPQATVVITNPTHYAIALKYEPGAMEAPVCVAKGVDRTALRIREVAQEHDIVIYENPPLARTLYDVVEVDEVIPSEQYKAVAEVISYVFRTKGRPRPKT